ncbi:MAG: ribose-phosphate pyrophosphokinase [Eubacteriales bacterium]
MGRNGTIKLFDVGANTELTKEIAKLLEIPLGINKVEKFSDGETSVQILETVRGCDVFLLQSTNDPTNDHLMELLIMIDAAKRASARRITAVIPYFGYARQDRKTRARDPITAKLVANLLTSAGADRVLTMDLHAPQIQGFFDIPTDNLYGMPILIAHYVKRLFIGDDLVVVGPDIGSVNRSRSFASTVNAPLAIIEKRRPKANQSEVMNVIGSVEGKRVLLVDDMIDTAGTIVKSAEALLQHGALEVYACCTHGVLSGDAVDKLNKSCIKELVMTNTILQTEDKKIDKIRMLSVAPMFAEAIERIHEDMPVSSLFTKAPTSIRPIGVQQSIEL